MRSTLTRINPEKYELPRESYEPLRGKASFNEKKARVAWVPGKHLWPKTNAQGLQLRVGVLGPAALRAWLFAVANAPNIC